MNRPIIWTAKVIWEAAIGSAICQLVFGFDGFKGLLGLMGWWVEGIEGVPCVLLRLWNRAMWLNLRV